jgi:hypothetical protein
VLGGAAMVLYFNGTKEKTGQTRTASAPAASDGSEAPAPLGKEGSQAPAAAKIIVWEKSFGGTNSDSAASVQRTADGGYIIAGKSRSINGDLTENHGSYDAWLIRIGPAGELKWQKSIGANASDEALSVKETPDGGFIFAGSKQTNEFIGPLYFSPQANPDFWMAKLSPEGEIIFEKSMTGTETTTASSVQPTQDGGYIAAGGGITKGGESSGSNFLFAKLSRDGNNEWAKSYGGTGDDTAYSVLQTSEGGYLAAGSSESAELPGYHGKSDGYLIKLDKSGIPLWQSMLGGKDDDVFYSVSETADGGFIAAGLSYSGDGGVGENHGKSDFWVVKLDSSGKTVWQKNLGGSDYDAAYSVFQRSDGGYVVSGISRSADGDIRQNHGNYDCWVIGLSAQGELEWEKSLGGSEADGAYSAAETEDKNIIIAGLSYSSDGDVTKNQGGSDLFVAKFSPPKQ